MLKNSFCCFRGVSAAAERKIWQDGCLAWRMLPLAGRAISGRKRQGLMDQVHEMEAALEGKLAGYFLSRLPPGHRLRVWPEFQERTLFLDIETTGLGPGAGITVIGALRAGVFTQYVSGVNMERFLEVAGSAELLITFNGIRFDWPMIECTFGCKLPIPHIDLMHEARAHGYRGGLKAIEPRIGIHREEDESGDGLLAVRLWQHYCETGEQAALERLLAYNRCDVDSLLVLSRKLLKLSMQHYPGPTINCP